MIESDWRSRAITGVIVVILLLQAFAVVFHTGSKGWPFIDYPMYSQSLEEGDRLDIERRLYATLADGSEVLIGPGQLGLSKDAWWIFRMWIVTTLDPLLNTARAEQNSWLRELIVGERGLAPSISFASRKTEHAATSWVADLYRRKHGKEIVGLRLEDDGIIVTRTGMKATPTRTLWKDTISDLRGGGR